MSEPLDQIIRTNPCGYVPEHPEHPPWVQPLDRDVHVAQTGPVLVVPLKLAGRVRLSGLDQPIGDEYDQLPEDMTRQSWGLPAQ